MMEKLNTLLTRKCHCRFSALTEKEMVAAQKVTCVDVMKSIRSQVKDLFSKR